MKRWPAGVTPGGPEDVGPSIREIAGRHGLGQHAAGALTALVVALGAEPHPPTTIRSPREVVDAHVADSLVALELESVRRARRLADLGAGAGFPGLPLAIALRAATVDLVEPRRRKCEVIERLATASGIPNARAVPLRAEEWGGGEGHEAYDLITARALGSLPLVAEYAAPLLARGGKLVAWRGRRDHDDERRGEAAASQLGLVVEEVVPVVPFVGARDRHLHVLSKEGSTPGRFPRRPGRAAKRPLA